MSVVTRERMMGFEPTTFCMARKQRDATQNDQTRQAARLRALVHRPDDSKRHQPTPKAD